MSHFLRPLMMAGAHPCSLINERTSSIVTGVLEAAVDSSARRRGLLGRQHMPEDRGFVLAPCNAVHTCFMRFPIDVAFVRRDGRVLKTVEHLDAWRLAICPKAFAAIEFCAGTLRRVSLAAGDRLVVQPAPVSTSILAFIRDSVG